MTIFHKYTGVHDWSRVRPIDLKQQPNDIDCIRLESGNVVEAAAKIEENVADLARYDDHVCNQLYA